MTEEEAEQYDTMIKTLSENGEKRTKMIKFYQEKIKTVSSDEIDECIKQLDKLKKELKLDMELREDIQNMLEVEHFLEYGNGVTFDPEY